MVFSASRMRSISRRTLGDPRPSTSRTRRHAIASTILENVMSSLASLRYAAKNWEKGEIAGDISSWSGVRILPPVPKANATTFIQHFQGG